MTGEKPVLLYFIHQNTSFTDIDETILSRDFHVKKFLFTIRNKWDVPILLVKQFFFLFKHQARRKKITMLSMFAGYHSFLPTLFHRLGRSGHFVVAGGIDSVSFPEADYGNYRKRLLRFFTGYTFRNSNAIFPISNYLVKSEYNYVPIHFKKQGILNLYYPINTPIKVIYNGFKTEKWFYKEDQPRKKASFLTIAVNIQDTGRAAIKGIDLIVDAAKNRPDYSFTIVGADEIMGGIELPKNIVVKPFIPHHELREIYCSHSVYLQMSMSEGFGNTLAEAMLCGCIPIGSNAGAIPEVIGDAGEILMTKNIADFLELIDRYAGEIDEALRLKARTRILTNFSIETRAKALLGFINNVH